MVLKIDFCRSTGNNDASVLSLKKNKQNQTNEKSFDLYKLFSLMIMSLSFDSFAHLTAVGFEHSVCQ